MISFSSKTHSNAYLARIWKMGFLKPNATIKLCCQVLESSSSFAFITVWYHPYSCTEGKKIRGGGEEQRRLTNSEECSIFRKSLMRESHGNHQASAFVRNSLQKCHQHTCGLLLALSVEEKKIVRSGLLTGLAMGHKARGMAHACEHATCTLVSWRRWFQGIR